MCEQEYYGEQISMSLEDIENIIDSLSHDGRDFKSLPVAEREALGLPSDAIQDYVQSLKNGSVFDL